MKKQLLFLLTFCLSAIGYSQVFTDNFITYTVYSVANNTVRVHSYDAAGGANVIIPATIDYNSVTYTVVAINQMAFMNKGLTSVSLPSTLTNIGLFAFATNQLSNIVIPNTVSSIGTAAFQDNQLTSANIPTSLTIIEDQVFRNNLLTSAVIPNGVTSIGQASFFGNQLTSVSIPSSVTNISSYAFNTNQLTSVTIPENVTFIGNFAFNVNPLANVSSLATTPPTITTSGDIFDTFAIDRSTIYLHIPPGTTGAYVTDAGALWTGFASTTEDALSTSNFELENEIKIITTENGLNIVSNNGLQLENYTIYNLSGQEIKSGIENQIETSTYSKGVYIMLLNFDKGIVTKKILIQPVGWN